LLLSVEDLKTYFFMRKGIVRAVDGVNFNLYKGETLGLAGESGCGKSVTALSIMRLIQPPGKIVSGKVLMEGEDLLQLPENEMCKIRGGKIAMIFQDPTAALNPVYRVGDQIAEAIQLHQGFSKKEALQKVVELFELVGISSDRVNEFPHQLSGGMKQRAMIAMAISCNPLLLIADEPTTNLDVTIQAQILDLMKKLKEKVAGSLLLITHHLGIIAEMCDRVMVMYAGEIVEVADTFSIFYDTKHPYTAALLKCLPSIKRKLNRLQSIRGTLPDPVSPPPGCKFYPRCPNAKKICKLKKPMLTEVSKGHFVACHIK